jgi:hypothetical protein
LKRPLIGHIPSILACHLQTDVDPDTANHFDADPDTTFQFDADPAFQHCFQVYCKRYLGVKLTNFNHNITQLLVSMSWYQLIHIRDFTNYTGSPSGLRILWVCISDMVTNTPFLPPPPRNTHLPAYESPLIKAVNNKLAPYKGHSQDEGVKDRNPDLQCVNTGSLCRIRFPTGNCLKIHTVFSYLFSAITRIRS